MRILFSKSPGPRSERILKEFENQAYPLMDQLFNTAMKMTRDPLDAEELVQETYVRAYRLYSQSRPKGSFRAWFFGILIDCFLTRWISGEDKSASVNRPPQEAEVSEGEIREMDKLRSPARPPDEVPDATVYSALDRLPLQYRLVVLLADVTGLNYREISEALKCSIGSVTSRLSRGRQLLSHYLLT